jgi:hypothetical protein
MFKIICAQISGISRFYDIFSNNPYQNEIIVKFYILMTIYYYMAMSTTAAWLLFPIENTQLFYWIFICTLFCYILLRRLYEMLYFKILSLNILSLGKDKNFYDFFLEEIYRLAVDSLKQENKKIILIHVLHIHK